jgi:uncharacterized membrane protein
MGLGGYVRVGAFIFYATWILAYSGVAIAALLGMVLMLAFFIVYRRLVFPEFFDGGFRTRWQWSAKRNAPNEPNSNRRFDRFTILERH